MILIPPKGFFQVTDHMFRKIDESDVACVFNSLTILEMIKAETGITSNEFKVSFIRNNKQHYQ